MNLFMCTFYKEINTFLNLIKYYKQFFLLVKNQTKNKNKKNTP